MLPAAGVHAGLPLLPARGLFARLLRRAASAQHPAAQRPRSAHALQLQPHRCVQVQVTALRLNVFWADAVTSRSSLLILCRAVNPAPAELDPHPASRSLSYSCFRPRWENSGFSYSQFIVFFGVGGIKHENHILDFLKMINLLIICAQNSGVLHLFGL